MVGIAEQYQYTLRDESIHLNFGIDVINQIKIENPQLWTKAFQEEVRKMIRTAAEFEAAYGRDTMPRGFLGLNAALCETYMHFIANRRCAQIDLAGAFEETENQVPVDVGSDGPEEGEKLLRDPRHRIPERRRAELGLGLRGTRSLTSKTGATTFNCRERGYHSALLHKVERLMQRATDAFVAECGDDTVPSHIGPQTGTDAAKYYFDLFGRQLLDQIPN
jgi:Ribonucleotide reductase, small chain